MATTYIIIYHDPVLSDQTVIEKMRPDGVPQLENPSDFQFAYKTQYANKMQKFFAGVASGSENAVIYSSIMSTSTSTAAVLDVSNGALAQNDTVSIGAVTFTAKNSPSGQFEFAIGASSQDTADNLLTKIRDAIGAGVFGGFISANPGDLPATLSIQCLFGAVGNLVPLTSSNNQALIWASSTFENQSGDSIDTVSQTNINAYGLSLGGGGEGGGGGGAFVGGLTPLTYGGTDYTGLGGSAVLYLFNTDTPETTGSQWVSADNQELVGIPGTNGDYNDFDVALIEAQAGENAVAVTIFFDHTLWALYSITPSFANVDDLLIALNIPVTLVGNWKANALTTNGEGTDYTWNGFTGFDQAGTVAVTTGFTTPPYIAFNDGNEGLAPDGGNPPGTYSATMAPLAWDGDDYDSPNFGDSTPGAYFMTYVGGPGGITHVDEDGVDIDGLPPDGEATPNYHACLMKFGGANPATCYVDRRWFLNTSNDEDAAGATNLFVNTFMLATATCENFKANIWTGNVVGLDYTFQGLSDFSEAGAVTLVTGDTDPPTVVFKFGP